MRKILSKELVKMMKKDKKIVLILAGVGEFQEVKKPLEKCLKAMKLEIETRD